MAEETELELSIQVIYLAEARLMADHLSSKTPLPPTVHLSPGVVMSSNLKLFREMRLSPVMLDDSLFRDRPLLLS
jgi:hypothetical protein